MIPRDQWEAMTAEQHKAACLDELAEMLVEAMQDFRESLQGSGDVIVQAGVFNLVISTR